MPRRTDISSILVIGAGPIVIGQACEFDYSGTQAVKALRDEGYRVILVNSNPATIMTDPELTDATYVEPITPEVVARVIDRERPDAVLPTMGGQTALNTARSLATGGVLDRCGTELIGATLEAIDKAEDRERFRDAMERIGLECARGVAVHDFAQARAALDVVGLPAIVRPSFTLGGTGGGIAYNREQFEDVVRRGLEASPVTEVLVEESVLGWKEYEMEVVRDRADNCIIVCSIENVDPMGVHTGDSITVAPALTLTDKEYQVMRNASFDAIREIGVDTGGSNVQFAIDPATGRMVVIELNPRVSRSSALASKATGFPIAKVAAKLAVGYTLDEIRNDLTGVTPASFEPAIDYVVTKVPRFTFEKFPDAEPLLTTSMKSVGEAMAIGRTFPESLQKALRSMETGLAGLDPVAFDDTSKDGIVARLARPSPDRILAIAQAMRHGFDDRAIHEITRYDPWFIEQLRMVVDAEEEIRANGVPGDPHALLRLKKLGFSDPLLVPFASAGDRNDGADEPVGDEESLRAARERAGVRPVFKRVDTCAAEFPSGTSYLYSCYEGDGFDPPEDEAEPTDAKKVIILGGGPNRIGQGIEFDYCCVHACLGLRQAGFETIMVNCNPETVSTDYDTSDRLYLEPLTVEDVLAVARAEMRRGELLGVIVQLGGQTPLRLAPALERAGIPIIGTSTDAIDRAEDRERFQALLDDLGLRQPPNGTCRTVAEAKEVAARIGYPVVVRPSYVLGGRAMEIAHGDDALERYVLESAEVAGDAPILIDRFLQDAVEIDVDALADGRDVFIAGIMEHIEEAGIHSGDSACSLPPCTLPDEVVEEVRGQTRVLARALGVVGLMNVQFAASRGGEIHVLEVNPRASRTVPFVAKAIGVPIARIAARIMAGEALADFDLEERPLNHVAVKEAVFPFARFPGVDVILGPEMKSTGEVMGLDEDFGRAFAKAQLAAGGTLPEGGRAFISVRDRDKPSAVELGRRLAALGFSLVATRGTAQALHAEGLTADTVNKVLEGPPHIVDALKDDRVDFMINTTESARSIADSFGMRRTALLKNVPYATTIAGASAMIDAIRSVHERGFDVAPLQSYGREAQPRS